MGYMSAAHIYRLYTDFYGYTLDFTGPQMVLTLKVTSFAFALSDARRDDKELSADQRALKITRMPTLLEYYSYIYFYGCFLAGPAIEYVEYSNFIAAPAPSGPKQPSYGMASLQQLGFALVYLVGTLSADKITMTSFADPAWIAASSVLYQTGYLMLAAFLFRCRYYFVWSLADGACRACGLGASADKDGRYTWELSSNVDVPAIELAPNTRPMFEKWNKKTALWLRRCVYNRVPVAKTAATYLVSAFWHGFYPGYYITFMSGALVTETARVLRRHVRQHLVREDGETAKSAPLKTAYDTAGWFFAHFALNYIVVPFVNLEPRSGLRFWLHWYFLPHILCAAAYFLLPVLLPDRRPRTKTA